LETRVNAVRSILANLARCIATLALAATTAAALAQTCPANQPVFADEFNGSALDLAKWEVMIGDGCSYGLCGWGNNELQSYQAANATVGGGLLTITAKKERVGSKSYTSTRLITQGKHEWTYGFFEIRAKLPCGQGTWPAIWMLNREVIWPAGGELDIMEHIGREPGRVLSSVHTATGHGANPAGAGRQVPGACTAFHDYQMHWTADTVRFGIDGVMHFEYKNPRSGPERWPFDKPQFLILNIAVGGDLGGAVDDTVSPVSMEIEHVRVYQRRP
jgi:beta-glucanase (GH16 family)